MRLPLAVLPVAALLVAGCLPGPRPVVGRMLVSGRGVEKPAFVGVNDTLWVTYSIHQKSATAGLAATYDLGMVSYDTGETRTLVANVSEKAGWERQGGGNLQFVVVDERQVPGPGGGYLSNVGTLLLFSFQEGEKERIENVSSFTLRTGQSTEFFYQVVNEGMRLPELHYRASSGSPDRLLGLSSGGAQFVGPGQIYFVGGEDRTLSRLTKADGDVQPVHDKVSRFKLNDDLSWVALQVVDGNKSQTVVHQLDTGVEHTIAGQNLIWVAFSPSTFVYSEPASSTSPAKLHRFEVATEKDTVTLAPAGMSDVIAVGSRSGARNDIIYYDSRGHVVLVPPGGGGPNWIGGAGSAPTSLWFPPDGKDALYVDLFSESPPEGRLMVQDLDFAAPARQLSPPENLVPQGGFFPIYDNSQQEIVVFWSHLGHAATDLYYADRASGNLRLVADGISEVVVTPYQLVGIVRVSVQDLVGDLINKDLVRDTEIDLGHEVADETVSGSNVAFVLRGRAPSDRDGLWAIRIDGVPPDAGVAGAGNLNNEAADAQP
jgi:hypothetical protein